MAESYPNPESENIPPSSAEPDNRKPDEIKDESKILKHLLAAALADPDDAGRVVEQLNLDPDGDLD